VTRRSGAWLTAGISVVAFAAACFLHMDAEYGPFNLTLHPADWILVWELFRSQQIAPRIVVQAALVGAAAAALPWIAFAWLTRRRGAG